MGAAVDPPRALPGAVQQAKCDRVHAHLFGQLVDHLLDGKDRRGRARGAVGDRLGLVDDHVVPVDLSVRDVIGRQDDAHAAPQRGARVGARLVAQLGLRGRDPAVRPGADLDPDRRARRWPGPEQRLGARHDHLDRAARLAGEERCQRVEVAGRLASERPADLGGDDADLGHRVAEQPGELVAAAERPLRGRVDGQHAVGTPGRRRSVWLEVVVVHGRGAERALDDHVGLGETALRVALQELRVAGHVAGGFARAGQRPGPQLLVQEGRVLAHGVEHVHHRRQALVFDFDQPDSLLGSMRVAGRDGSDGVPGIEHLVAGQRIVAAVLEPGIDLSLPGCERCVGREVRRRDHGVHAGIGRRAAGIDR